MPDETPLFFPVAGAGDHLFRSTHLVWPQYCLGQLSVFADKKNVIGEYAEYAARRHKCFNQRLKIPSLLIPPVEKCLARKVPGGTVEKFH